MSFLKRTKIIDAKFPLKTNFSAFYKLIYVIVLKFILLQSNFKTQTNLVMTSEKEESGNLDITETLGKTELFIDKNKKRHSMT